MADLFDFTVRVTFIGTGNAYVTVNLVASHFNGIVPAVHGYLKTVATDYPDSIIDTVTVSFPLQELKRVDVSPVPSAEVQQALSLFEGDPQQGYQEAAAIIREFIKDGI